MTHIRPDASRSLVVPSLAVGFTDDEIAAVQADLGAILRSGTLILGPYTERFEQHVAALAGTGHAVATSSGTSALEIIFRSLAVAGRAVLVPTNTNYATAAAAINAGARVILYDNDVYPDLADLHRKLGSLAAEDSDVAAVVVVHIGGYLSPELPALAAACRAARVPLVEDAAHAHGASLNGRPAGSWGEAAAFSFYPTKVITSGEGGAITTNDPDLAALARQHRDQGKTSDGRLHTVWGNSWRITEIGAALALAQLAHHDRDAAHRRAALETYRRDLADLPQLAMAGGQAHNEPSGYKAIGLLRHGIDRSRFKADVLTARVQLGREVYEVPLHRQPVFADRVPPGEFPRADDFAARHICLPIWRHIRPEQVDDTVRALRAALDAGADDTPAHHAPDATDSGPDGGNGRMPS